MNQPIPLSQENLQRLPDAIARPEYDRSQIKTGIVHIGVGGFHRSHEAYYTDALMNSGDFSQWGICGVGLREADRKIASVLEQQDYLYTLIVRKPGDRIADRFHDGNRRPTGRHRPDGESRHQDCFADDHRGGL